MDFDDLTLLVPVRERRYNLDRVFTHYKDLDCKKIVVDSSKKRYNEEHKAKDFGFEYDYCGPTHYPELKYEMLSKTQTEFVIDCPDDDLFLISSIEAGVDFLRKNENYVSCYGEEWRISPGRDRNRINWERDNQGSLDQFQELFCVRIKQPKQDRINCSGTDKSLFGTTDPKIHAHHLKAQFYTEDPIERIKFNCVPMLGSAHCLYRTKELLKINKLIFDNDQLHPIGWAEQVTDILASIAGNRKILSCIWAIKQVGERLIDVLPEEEMWGPGGEQAGAVVNNLEHNHLDPICEVLSEFTTGLEESYEIIRNIFITINDTDSTGVVRPLDFPYHASCEKEISSIAELMSDGVGSEWGLWGDLV